MLVARLVVVVGVLAGLVFAHCGQCTGRMTAMVFEPAASSSMMGHTTHDGAAASRVEGRDHSPDAVAAVPVAMGVLAFGGARSPGLGGMLAACLMCIVAVAAAIVALRPSPVRIIVALLTSLRGCRMIPIARARAPSLAELCLLRT